VGTIFVWAEFAYVVPAHEIHPNLFGAYPVSHATLLGSVTSYALFAPTAHLVNLSTPKVGAVAESKLALVLQLKHFPNVAPASYDLKYPSKHTIFATFPA